jgi:hypothetical protein
VAQRQAHHPAAELEEQVHVGEERRRHRCRQRAERRLRLGAGHRREVEEVLDLPIAEAAPERVVLVLDLRARGVRLQLDAEQRDALQRRLHGAVDLCLGQVQVDEELVRRGLLQRVPGVGEHGRVRAPPREQVELGRPRPLARVRDERRAQVELVDDVEHALGELALGSVLEEQPPDVQVGRAAAVFRDERIGGLLHAVVREPVRGADAIEEPFADQLEE